MPTRPSASQELLDDSSNVTRIPGLTPSLSTLNVKGMNWDMGYKRTGNMGNAFHWFTLSCSALQARFSQRPA